LNGNSDVRLSYYYFSANVTRYRGVPDDDKMPMNKKIDQARAFYGSVGKQRTNFCLNFIKQKQDAFRRIEDEIFAQVAANDEEVTCRKGCPVCCVLYIEANIQECEAISYYLYENTQVMNSFLERYELWRGKMKQLGGPFALCERVLHQSSRIKLSKNDLSALLNVLQRYQEQNIPCCFLENGACSIYTVRPFVCANHMVTTPAEWCRSENWCNPAFPNRPKIYMTTIDEINDNSIYQCVLAKPVIGFMPTMVYRILTEGLDYIAESTGINGLLSVSGLSDKG
jgi:Fe-S-cluster containining protein